MEILLVIDQGPCVRWTPASGRCHISPSLNLTTSEVATIIDLLSQQSSPTQRSSAPLLYVLLQRTETFSRSARATRHSTSRGPQRCYSIFVDKFLKDILTE
ncbi:hypothetical protein PTTG_29264, partial [Puccinia triticina 1-1 BBBD Race 1]